MTTTASDRYVLGDRHSDGWRAEDRRRANSAVGGGPQWRRSDERASATRNARRTRVPSGAQPDRDCDVSSVRCRVTQRSNEQQHVGQQSNKREYPVARPGVKHFFPSNLSSIKLRGQRLALDVVPAGHRRYSCCSCFCCFVATCTLGVSTLLVALLLLLSSSWLCCCCWCGTVVGVVLLLLSLFAVFLSLSAVVFLLLSMLPMRL